jgi:hypothetical protein
MDLFGFRNDTFQARISSGPLAVPIANSISANLSHGASSCWKSMTSRIGILGVSRRNSRMCSAASAAAGPNREK